MPFLGKIVKTLLQVEFRAEVMAHASCPHYTGIAIKLIVISSLIYSDRAPLNSYAIIILTYHEGTSMT